jgi:hypothetical protein
MNDMSGVYAKVWAEIVALFGWDAGSLSPDQSLRLDCAVALRLALDDLQGRIVRGESIDVAKMLTAADALSRLLPAAALAAPPPASNAPDPRQIMLETYMGMRKRGEIADPTSTFEGRMAEIERLKARIAELESALAVSGGSTVQNRTVADNVVALRPSPTGPSGLVPSPPPAPPKPVVPAPTGLLTDAVDEPWRPFVGGGGPGYDLLERSSDMSNPDNATYRGRTRQEKST